MKFCYRFFVPFCLAFLLLVTACQSSGDDRPTELLISAAVSLQESLKEIQMLYETHHTDVKLHFNFGASGTLRQQIEQGAAVDLFLSADGSQIEQLVHKKQIDSTDQTVFLHNELVAVVPVNSRWKPRHVDDLTEQSIRVIALGNPQTVPAGAYTREALIFFNTWTSLQEKVVFGNNVRQVLAYVETENADIGFVYKTDSFTTDKVKIAFTLDSESHQPIRYYAGIVNNHQHPQQANEFYHYLQGDEAQEIFHKHGFESESSR